LPRTGLLAYLPGAFLQVGPMRVLYLYCHPLPESFHAAIRVKAIEGLKAAGHEVDLIDLYADGFNPVLSEEARRHYHDTSRNQAGLEGYIARLKSADALVVQFPVWCFGMPAMLKGFIDRMFMPGVAFDISDPTQVRPMLGNLKHIAGIVTYGRPRWMAFTMGDPPRKIVKRYLPWFTGGRARVHYHALYHMNVASAEKRSRFLAKVRREMSRF
jgi:NAD(P)H dehydrogenase (quinone)